MTALGEVFAVLACTDMRAALAGLSSLKAQTPVLWKRVIFGPFSPLFPVGRGLMAPLHRLPIEQRSKADTAANQAFDPSDAPRIDEGNPDGRT